MPVHAPVGGVILNSKVPGDPATVEMDYNESVTKGAFDAGTVLLPVMAAWNTCLTGHRRFEKAGRNGHSDDQTAQQRPDH